MGRVAWSQAVSPLAFAANRNDPPPKAMPCVSLLERFSAEIADHGDIERASTAIRVPLGVGQSLYERLCRNMGDQAQ